MLVPWRVDLANSRLMILKKTDLHIPSDSKTESVKLP